jgi:hypothetical protein
MLNNANNNIVNQKDKVYFNKATGYYTGYDPKRKEYIAEHQIMMERKLGRRLRPNEVVHHRDENKKNNSMSNLRVETKQQHAKDHGHRWEGHNNPSFNMTARHKRSLRKAWIARKHKFGPTGAKNPTQLRKLGKIAGKKR